MNVSAFLKRIGHTEYAGSEGRAIAGIFNSLSDMQAEVETKEFCDVASKISHQAPETLILNNNTCCDGRIYMIDPHRITPNPSQPRKSFEDDSLFRLADSIRQYGILQPLTVRRIPDLPLQDCLYELIAGERRLRAAKKIDMKAVPCIVIEADGKRSAELAIIENIHREGLNIFEQAAAIASLIDIYKITQEEAARQLSSSQSYIANKLRILRLTEAERNLILQYGLTERHARALLKINDTEKRIRAINHIALRNLNVAATEAYISELSMENEAEKENGEDNQKISKIIIKDMRLFYNTVDKAISTIRRAGISITSDRIDTADSTEIIIRIPKGSA